MAFNSQSANKSFLFVFVVGALGSGTTNFAGSMRNYDIFHDTLDSLI